MMQRPILVMCMGRSGSSMVTEVIARHGAWAGNCLGADKKNPRGYWENQAIKKEVVRRCGQAVNRLAAPDPTWRSFVHKVLEREGYRGGPWVVKHFAAFWRLWDDFSPIWILPRRDSGAIFRSVRKAGFNSRYDDQGLRDVIELHQGQLDLIRDSHGGVEVDTHAVVSGDLTTLEHAVKRCGLSFDRAIASNVINPDYWHQEPV